MSGMINGWTWDPVDEVWTASRGAGRWLVCRRSRSDPPSVAAGAILLQENRLRAQGAERIAAERSRQITDEGWTAEHDHNHVPGELARAAMAYITGDAAWWPWPDGFKPGDRMRNLVKAGALIAAEIDRAIRLTPEGMGGKLQASSQQCPVCLARYPGHEPGCTLNLDRIAYEGAIGELDERVAGILAAHQSPEMTELAQAMIQMLHIAVHGSTWARPQSPRNVWLSLLAEVAVLAKRGGR